MIFSVVGYRYYLQLALEKNWFKGEDPIHARAVFNADAEELIHHIVIDKMTS